MEDTGLCDNRKNGRKQSDKVMEERKILILSLGTGRMRDKDTDRTPAEKIIYQSAKYRMDDTKDIIETEFSAEPLIHFFEPDEVIIIGTSRSAWAGFYCKFGDKSDSASVERLQEIETEGGKDISGSALQILSREVEEIYAKGLSSGLFRNICVHVIMIRYGINEAELKENYALLGSIGERLKQKVHYKAAFDITHSFRSLPLYNLVILNYFKNISMIDLEISHVYYGNLDIRRENGDIAPIVDMAELIKVLDLSNGVSEFKNTGNAVSLLKYIPDEEEFGTALNRFDWATQINSLDRIADSLKELMEAVNRKNDDRLNKYADLREMVSHVIQIKFFEENGMEHMEPQEFGNLPVEEKQFLICKWYFRQNRYGQAVVTGMEALRSYLICICPGAEQNEQRERWMKDEQARRKTIDTLQKVYQVLSMKKRNRDEAEQLLYDLESSRRAANRIRNIFAHNLGRDTVDDKREENVSADVSAKKIVEDFIHQVSRFRQYMHEQQDKIKDVYRICLENRGERAEYDRIETAEMKLVERKDFRYPARLIVAEPGEKVVYENYSKPGKKATVPYNVYRLTDKAEQYLDRVGVRRASLFLGEYIMALGFDMERLEIFLCGFSLKKMMNYSAVLYDKGFKNISDGEKSTIPKIMFPMDFGNKGGGKNEEETKMPKQVRHLV